MQPDPIPLKTPVEVLSNSLRSSRVLAELYLRLKLSLAGIKQVDDYIAGKHQLAFATEKFNNAFGELFRAFADNYCPKVVTTPADRLQLSGVKVTDDGLQKKVNAWLTRNRIDRLAGQTHDSAFRYGDGFVILAETATAGEFRLYQQHSDEVRVLYDPEEPTRVCCAIKVWRQWDGSYRLNVYQQESTFRFVSLPKQDAATVTGALLTSTGVRLATPLPADLSEFQPLMDMIGPQVIHKQPGCPVFHFANNPGRDGHGKSELCNIIPLQDALNKSICDLLVGSEYHALPQRFATGIELDVDEETGKPKAPFLSDTSRLWYSGNSEVTFGAFPPADLSQLLKVSESFRIEIARIADIPLHYLVSGESSMPSGEALKTAEMPLMAKVKDRQIIWGDVWEDVVALWLALTGTQGVEGKKIAGDDFSITADWVDTSPRNAKEEADAKQVTVDTMAAKLTLGVSKKQVLRELSYTDQQIEQFDQENELDAETAAEQQLTALAQGTGMRR